MAHTVVTDEQHASFVATRAENALNFIFAYAPCLVLFLACGHIMHTVAVQISKIAKRLPMEKIFTGIIFRHEIVPSQCRKNRVGSPK